MTPSFFRCQTKISLRRETALRRRPAEQGRGMSAPDQQEQTARASESPPSCPADHHALQSPTCLRNERAPMPSTRALPEKPAPGVPCVPSIRHGHFRCTLDPSISLHFECPHAAIHMQTCAIKTGRNQQPATDFSHTPNHPHALRSAPCAMLIAPCAPPPCANL